MVVPISRLSKKDRQNKLSEFIENNPFITDEDLTKEFNVSIQTIRLDRMELGIPELRERTRVMASKTLDNIKSLHLHEVIGEIIDIQLDQYGISLLEINDEQVFKKTGIARGHYIFAQANSLAVALINDEIALTSKADIRFIRPVYLNERLIAKAKVIGSKDDRSEIEVNTYVNNDLVFRGIFIVYRLTDFNPEKGVDTDENSD